LDEPTLGLDPDGTNKMLDLIVSLSRDRGITVMLSSHQLEQVQRICTRVGIMIKGKLVALGTIAELAQRKLGDTAGPNLEEIYMRYFKET
jgi:ABC-2 type transport system ATP-binding protein